MTEITPLRILRLLARTILPALLVVLILGGCSAEARKARHLNRAEKYFKAGEFEKAKIEYLNVLRAEPQNAAAYQRMGAIWLEQGAPLRAGGFLVRGRELAPGDVANRLKLGRVFLSASGHGEARKEAEAILEQSPNNADAVRLLVEASRTPEEMKGAEEQLQRITDRDNVSFQLAAATLSLRKGDIPGAEKSLTEALRLDPKASSAHTAMAAVHLLQKDLTKAAAEFKAAADSSPMRSIEQIQYAEFKAQTGGAAEAIASLKAITAQAPDYLPAWRLLGQIALSEKRYDEALALLENVFRLDPENLDSRMVQAQVRVAKGEGAKAVEVLQGVDKAYPRVPAIKIQLARANLLINDVPAATAAANDAVAVDPENVEAKLLLAEINLRIGEAPPVVNAMTEVLKKYPNLIQAQLLLVDAYRLQGRLDEAAAIFREQIKTSPQSANAYLGLGVVLRQQEKGTEARTAFEKAAELAPGNVIAFDQLVELDIADKAFDSAMARVGTQFQGTPELPSTHVSEGKIWIAQAQWDKAEAALSKALQLDPNYWPAYDLLIATYVAGNKLPQAAGQLETLIVKNPANAAALMQLALIYEKMEQFAKAAETYEKLVLIKPETAPAWNNLAYLYAEKLNQLDKAAEAGRRARLLQPGDASIADTFGWVLYRQGDYQQALSLLQESAGKLGDNPEVQFHLGMASYMMGQTEIARTSLRKATEAAADFPGKDEARKRLALLGDAAGPSAGLSIQELETLLQKEPNDLSALMRIGEAYATRGEALKAADAFEKALKINPKLVPPTLKLAELYGGPLKNSAKALEYGKKARELAPSDANVAAILGRVAFETGNWAWAYSLFQESARRMPDNAAVQHGYAWAAYSLGKVPEAQQAMERVATLAPASPDAEDAKSFLAMVSLEASRKSDDVGPAVRKLLGSDPNYVPALMARARMDVNGGDPKSVEDIYNHILQLFPEFAPAQRELARLYLANPASIGKAYDFATKARKTLPDDAELGVILGAISYQKKDYAQAVQAFQQSARKKPLDAASLFYLGVSQINTKQGPVGRQTLQQALAAGLNGDNEQEARRLIDDKTSN